MLSVPHPSARLVPVACALSAVLALAPCALASPTAANTTISADAQTTADVSWDERGRLVLGAADALAALETLPEDSPAAVSWGEGGSRTGWFGQAWMDVDGDGCDTRNEILARDLSDVDFSREDGTQGLDAGRGQGAAVCPDATVWSGTLHDPYTGATIAFQRGQDTSDAVQIDHVVPLNYLYAHGAWAWDERQRLLVANDPLNLLAVDGAANQDKSNCGPATCPAGSTETGTWTAATGPGWWPDDVGYRCEYARRFVSVAAAYNLGLPDADADALRTALTDCAAGGNGAVSVPERVRRVGARVGRTVLSNRVYTLVCAAGALLIGLGLLARGRAALRAAGGKRPPRPRPSHRGR
ncbi:HNH endonuclease family protein [Actinomyces ruminis]|uniref:HNH endonuclease n=1 Tax=Actinomyces ruminis TaxID=1937003 RepID=A0ABX4M9T4_9ACTO|nr:HNH endonuclease family protein [Actinomyces ruminis]PHP52046.1 HNH endonuclease [Actinomyces ruminis]